MPGPYMQNYSYVIIMHGYCYMYKFNLTFTCIIINLIAFLIFYTEVKLNRRHRYILFPVGVAI